MASGLAFAKSALTVDGDHAYNMISMTKAQARQVGAVARQIESSRAMTNSAEREMAVLILGIVRSLGSIRQVAKRMGISAAYLSDITRGNRKASEAVIEKLMAL